MQQSQHARHAVMEGAVMGARALKRKSLEKKALKRKRLEKGVNQYTARFPLGSR